MGSEAGQSERVKCHCGQIEGSGTFEVDGRHLVLRSSFGVKKVLLGLATPRRLARKLLRNLCESEAAKQQEAVAGVETPAPAIIDAVETIPALADRR